MGYNPNASSSALKLSGTTSGAFTETVTAATATYSVIWPASQAASSGYLLTNDGAGNLSWSPPAATGVTSVALALPGIFTVTGSPVTSTGTLTGSFITQAANTVFAGP